MMLSPAATPKLPSVTRAEREVALLPAFDPAVGATMVMAGLVAGMDGAQATDLSPILQTTMGDRQAEFRYRFGLEGMTSDGTIQQRGRAPMEIHETFREHGQNQARLAGNVGDWPESLQAEPTEGGLHVQGTVGSVPVNLTYTLGSGGDQRQDGQEQAISWARVSGTIGSSAYQAEATLGPLQGEDLADIQVSGSLGGDPLAKTYRVTTDQTASAVVFDGSGQAGGAPQTIHMEINLSPDRLGLA